MERIFELFERLVAAVEKIAAAQENQKWDGPRYTTDAKEPAPLDETPQNKPEVKSEVKSEEEIGGEFITPDPKEVFPTYDGLTAKAAAELCEKRGIEVRTPGASRNKPTKNLIEALKQWDKDQREKGDAPETTQETPDPAPEPENKPDPAPPVQDPFGNPGKQDIPDPFGNIEPPYKEVVQISHADLLDAAQKTMAICEGRTPGSGTKAVYEAVRSVGVDYIKDVPEDKRMDVIRAMSQIVGEG